MRRRLLGGLVAGLAGALSLTALVLAAPGVSPVADAAMRNDTAAVRSLLTQGGDVNAAQADGMTALHWAAMNGDVAMAQMLMYAGADVNASTRLGGLTPLDLAAKDGQAEMVEALLKGGADAKMVDAHGTTPLMFAAAAGSDSAVSALLNAGADVNAKESTKNETALMFAAAYGRTGVVRILLAHGADWRPASKVLNWANLAKKDPHDARFYRAGATLDEHDGHKVQTRPVNGQGAANVEQAQPVVAPVARAQMLLAQGRGNGTATPIKEAAGKRSRMPAKHRSPRMSYADLVGTQGGLTALLFAARQGDLATVQALVQGGADVNEVDPGGKTSPLLIATINGRFDTAMYLLDHGANPNLAEFNGVTPLYAVINCQWHAKSEFPHPLAYENQKTTYLQLMKALLARGANPNARINRKVWYSNYNDDQSGIDEAGATPFWRAAYADDVVAMKLLVAHGANPNIPTKKQGLTGPYAPPPSTKDDRSGLPPVPVGGPDIPPLLAAAGEGYGWSFAANHHRYAPTGMLAAVKYLVDVLHADVNARDANGNTVLHDAAARGDNAMILFLVSRGANVHAVNRKGQTVADMANGPFQRTQPFPQTLALLQKLGARIMHKCVSC